MEKKYYNEMVKKFIELEPQMNGGAIYLFGHCEASLTLADFLLAKEVQIKGILDNSQQKQGLEYKKIPVVKPDIILEDNNANTVVFIVTRFYEAMNSQLRDLGFVGKVIKLVDYNTYAEYSLDEEVIARKTKRLEEGIKILERVKLYYKDCFVLLCPFNALGDIYFAMSYLPMFLRKKCYKDVVICVPSIVCGDVARLFDITNIEVFSQNELDALIQAVIYTEDKQCYIAHQDRPYVVDLHKILAIKLIPLDMIYRCGVYGLPIDTVPVEPVNWKEYDRLNNIIEGKAVIISPYAKSVVGIQNDIWKEIVDDYKSQGYQIFTNVVGDEVPLEGTEALTAPLNEMKSVVERAGTFIGIRSGLCDVLKTANCRKIALYPDYNYCDTKWKAIDMYAIDSFENIVVNGDYKWRK